MELWDSHQAAWADGWPSVHSWLANERGDSQWVTAHENHGKRPSQHEDYMKRQKKNMKKNNSGKNTQRASQINK